MSKVGKIAIVVVLAAAVIGVVVMKKRSTSSPATQPTSQTASGLPRLVDLGSTTCVPCKMMAPILEELEKEYAGRMRVEFIDVNQNPDAAKPFGIQLIPTQVFFDASGKELWRHKGFISKEDILAKWKEFGVTFADAQTAASQPASAPVVERLAPAKADTRAKDAVCYLCDKDIDAKTLVVVKTDKGDVRLCSPHCFFIMYSCLTEDKTGFEQKVSVTDWGTGKAIPAMEATYLYGLDVKTGRPTIKAFGDKDAADKELKASGGSLIAWQIVQEKELENRCGFCDRACYPADSAKVAVGGVNTLGCCSHCALGVAARTGKDIEVHERDRLTGEEIVIKTAGGNVASLQPGTAVGWFGLRQGPDGQYVSAGCFHQGFFASPDNLKTWLEQNPLETGRLITIQRALADKMKLSPQQIQKACKMGQCAPK
ncbi:MAG: organomercurial lyase [Planctomycetota bacterium]|nr:organomercurial lyase [Planctomycetota bacterium]